MSAVKEEISEKIEEKNKPVVAQKGNKRRRNSAVKHEEENPVDDDQLIVIKVTAQDGCETFFRQERTKPLRRLMTVYCERNDLDKDIIRFIFDGRRIKDTETPIEIGMEEGDEISAMSLLTGGGFA